ncbi:MAG TPA: aminomethyl-transferring glycine dehydrogenase subunit GcvPA [Gammaproteobacteria bacterium]|nr:aminomethyl-transferring glycine dehydrogenase subunit GcvPA [Gammaproteobacteria bacterium]
MPFIPHTKDDVARMLDVIGASSIDQLFDEIPANLRVSRLPPIPPALTEMELLRLMRERAKKDITELNFIGAGAYEHHIPAAVWDITSRGEFMTAYTPYQAEASQGTLQLLYEYQTMMASLMGLDVSNASLYDGGSSLAEAVLMAVRLHRNHKKHRILMPTTVHPFYRQVVKTIVSQQAIEIVEVPFDAHTGTITIDQLEKIARDNLTALVIPQPNFFGQLEDVDVLTHWAHANQALVIGVVNPLAMALLKPPGQWGKSGADIACGEGQPLGVPLASGGPYYGFLCCKEAYVRQLPGRIAGRTVDQEGRPGFVLTLQAREQHIRRAKATSNICTNQGLLVTASTIHMSLLGPNGLRKVALACHHNLQLLREKLKLKRIHGVRELFSGHAFHEIVIALEKPVDEVLAALARQHIQAGFSLKKAYPLLGNALLICVTETKTPEDLDTLVNRLEGACQN